MCGSHKSSSSFGVARSTRRPWARPLAGTEYVQNSVKKPCERTIFECPRNGDDIKKNLKERECDHD
jgi:hypothetical protein